MAVGQRQVEEHELGLLERQELEPTRQTVGAAQAKRRGRILPQHLLDEAGIAGVVLDQEDRLRDGLLDDHRTGGSVAMVSQKRSIDCTTVMNFSRSTGLVT